MKCTTIRNGVECPMMSPKGCTFGSGQCRQTVDQCHGCSRVIKFQDLPYCHVAPDPSAKWRNGDCNIATHLTKKEGTSNKKVNPLKASKRSKK